MGMTLKYLIHSVFVTIQANKNEEMTEMGKWPSHKGTKKENVSKAHKKQVLTSLKLTGKKLGYLLNFDDEVMKEGISRILNEHVE